MPDNPFLVVHSLASYGNLLFIAGYHIDSASSDVQVFDGMTLTSLTNYQLNNGVRDMSILDDTLFIAGLFRNCFPPENISGVAKYSVPVSQLTGYKKTDKETEIDISLYPNPIESWFSINNASQITAIEISNILGQSIYQNNNFQAQNNERIAFPETGKGMYVVRIRNANGLWNSFKVIKN